MSLAERIYKIEQLLNRGRPISLRTLCDHLEVSRATIQRDFQFLRDRYHSPVVYDRTLGGYRRGDAADATLHQLPGLWFDAKEIHALLTFYHFLEDLEPGLLTAHIAPLKERIKTLLESKDQAVSEIARRVRILPQAARRNEPAHFQSIAHALLTRRRVAMRYRGRERGEITERAISPQRLVHYRDNWYLDAWDHGKRALRTFSLDRIADPALVERAANDVSDAKLNRHFTESYGIFAGRPRRTAILKFNAARSRWIADERWHPNQRGRFEGEHYILEVPYSDDREIILDILRYGPDVEVLRPKSLRTKVLDRLLQAVSRYRG